MPSVCPQATQRALGLRHTHDTVGDVAVALPPIRLARAESTPRASAAHAPPERSHRTAPRRVRRPSAQRSVSLAASGASDDAPRAPSANTSSSGEPIWRDSPARPPAWSERWHSPCAPATLRPPNVIGGPASLVPASLVLGGSAASAAREEHRGAGAASHTRASRPTARRGSGSPAGELRSERRRRR